MQGPSAAILINTCDIWRGDETQDADGALQETYTRVASGVPCSIQAYDVREVMDAQMRVTIEREYHLFFDHSTGISVKDKFVFTDGLGQHQAAFAHIERDEAGRGACFVVRAIERI
jgi:hypothetical protein